MSHTPEPIPPQILVAAAALVGASLIGVAFSQVTGLAQQNAPAEEIVEQVSVRFADEADGGVGVYDHASGAIVKIFPPAAGGFVRTAMRAVAHDRKQRGVGPEAPFTLARTASGRLVLTDSITGVSIGLEAFGDANEHDFAQLLDTEDRPG